jgi:2-iminobutanoate/2-iminopropanoate deaminase
MSGPAAMPSDEASHPYSAARAAGPYGFVSGALSVDADGQPVPGRREALDAAMARLEERLAPIGGRLDQVVKATYFVTDVSLRAEANEQFRDVFTPPRPARSFVEVRSLPYGATVEIEATTFDQQLADDMGGTPR